MSNVEAPLTSNSAEDFVQRVSTLSMIASRQNAVLGEAATPAETTASTGATARKAAADAQATYDTVASQQQRLRSQIQQYEAEFDQLSAQEKRASIDIAGGRASRGADRSDPAALGSVVASSRAAQVGKPYVWGAPDPNSFDRSGLVQYAYQAADISLPTRAPYRQRWGSRSPALSCSPET